MSIYIWQNEVWQKLASMQERLPHALLLRGQAGTGKYDFAQHLAQSLLCLNRDAQGHACQACTSCSWFVQSHHPDYRLLTPEQESDNEDAPASATGKKSQISVAQVRDLFGFLELTSHQSGGRRVVVIHPAEALNVASANALLKILEEPPAGVIFLLVSHQPQRLLPTILSRCQKIDMPVPQEQAALAWLQQNGVKDSAHYLAYAGGSPLLALQMSAENNQQLEGLWQSLSKGSKLDPFAVAPLCAKQGMPAAVQALQKWVYDLVNCRLTGEIRYHEQSRNALQGLAKSVDLSLLLELQRKLDQARKSATHPLNTELQLENLLLQYVQIFPTAGGLR